MTREDILERLWRDAENSVYISREQFSALLEGTLFEEVVFKGVVVGTWAVRGAEAHYASFETRAGIPLQKIRESIQGLLDKNGVVTTKTLKESCRQHTVNKRLGFFEVGSDEFFIHYRLEAVCR